MATIDQSTAELLVASGRATFGAPIYADGATWRCVFNHADERTDHIYLGEGDLREQAMQEHAP